MTSANAQEPGVDLKKTELSAKVAADLVVLSLPYYMAKKDGDAAKYPLLLNRLTPENLPASGNALAKLLGENATAVLDVDRRLLFWDFQISLRDSQQLLVRAAGNEAIGSPIVSITVGKPPDLTDAKRLAEQIVQRTTVGAEGPLALVAHSLPRLGLIFRMKDGHHFVVDLTHLRKYAVPSSVVRYNNPTPYVWSPYDWLTIKKFEMLVKQFRAIVAKRRATVELAVSITDKCVDLTRLIRVDQEEAMWCVPATAQMILKFHGISKTQGEIATAMMTDYFYGTEDADEFDGYYALLGDALEPIYMTPADFSPIQSEINLNRPTRFGAQGHVLALACWRTAETTHQLLTYDPSPGASPAYVEWDTLPYGSCASFGACDTIFVRPAE
jgi:hypothetical protein